eukprot:s133_g10.t1
MKAGKKRRARELCGDGFGKGAENYEAGGSGFVYPCFGFLFQGDHLGVEFALAAHEEVLRQGGLLRPSRRLQGHSVFPITREYKALIIDDYFALSVESVSKPSINSFAASALAAARQIYADHKMLGCPEKDVEASDDFTAAGAEIRSTTACVQRGIVSVTAPWAKRMALSVLSLRAASLPALSAKVLARLSGSWISVLMYRRCMMSIVSDLFRLAADAEASGANVLVPLPRATVQELSILAALAPIIMTNVASKMSATVFASDALLGFGAVVSTKVEERVAEAVWLGSDKKGCYSKFDSDNLALLAAAGEDNHELSGTQSSGMSEQPRKSPLLYFDFVEFYGGAGRVSECMQRRGFSVAPPLDLTASRHYDLSDCRLLEWCFYMIESGRFGAFLSEPPCTSFSPAAHPMVRSYEQPEGFDMSEEKTFHGNLLANRSFLLLRHGRRYGRPCGKEQPRLSKMAWLPAWRSLLQNGFSEFVCASCQFKSIHKKEFRFLVYLLDSAFLDARCPGGHTHVRIEGCERSSSRRSRSRA